VPIIIAVGQTVQADVWFFGWSAGKIGPLEIRISMSLEVIKDDSDQSSMTSY